MVPTEVAMRCRNSRFNILRFSYSAVTARSFARSTVSAVPISWAK